MELKEHQENRFEKGIYDKRNKINNLTGKEWVFSTRSVKTKEYRTHIDISSAISKSYYDFLPVELIIELFMTFVKPNSTIFDLSCNFGSSALAAHLTEDKINYYGFNFIKTDLIKFKSFINEKSNINLITKSIQSVNILKSKIKPNLIFSELIFSSKDSSARNRSVKLWLDTLITSISYLLKFNLINCYLIISIQNTIIESQKDSSPNYTTYINNVNEVNSQISNLNFILKGEIIWKIPRNYKIPFKSNSNFKLNDKRILIYRME